MDSELPYDYSSIMHYRFDAFAKNYSLGTIELKNKTSTNKHTPYSYITDLDVRKTNEMYNCVQGKKIHSPVIFLQIEEFQ